VVQSGHRIVQSLFVQEGEGVVHFAGFGRLCEIGLVDPNRSRQIASLFGGLRRLGALAAGFPARLATATEK